MSHHYFLGEGPREVLEVSCDGDDRRIFGGLKFLIPGFSWVGKFPKYFFGLLDLSREFFGGITDLDCVAVKPLGF